MNNKEHVTTRENKAKHEHETSFKRGCPHPGYSLENVFILQQQIMTAMHNVRGCIVWSPPCASAGCLYSTGLSASLALFITDIKSAILYHLEETLWPLYEFCVVFVFSQARKFPLVVNPASHQEGYC